MPSKTAILFIAAYLAGSINFSILLFKILGKDDPRGSFSGNPGTTNVYRQAGWLWAAVVLLLDMARAMGVALAAGALLKIDLVPWIGLALIVGNRFPCFHGLRGGKGVANYLGFTVIITPAAAAVAALAWVVIYAVGRVPFIGSFAMVAILGMGTLAACKFNLLAAGGILTTMILIYYSHRTNLVKALPQKKTSQPSPDRPKLPAKN